MKVAFDNMVCVSVMLSQILLVPGEIGTFEP